MEEEINNEKQKAEVFDDLLIHIGEYGRYQRHVHLLLCLPALVCAWHQVSWVFLGATADHRCLLPYEVADIAKFELPPGRANFTLPWDSLRGAWSQCERFDANFSNQNFDIVPQTNRSVACTEWVFDHSKYSSSAVFEFGLVCSQQWARAGADFIMMFGDLIGSIILGDLSDRYGRRPAFFCGLVLQVTAGTLASQAPSYWSFMLARFVIGLSLPGVYIVAYVLGMEMVGPSKRQFAGVLLQIFFSVGYMMTALFAFLIEDWRDLQLALALPGLIFLVYWWLVPESARWLVGSGQVIKGLDVLQHAARVNKSEMQGAPLEEALISVLALTLHDPQRLNIKPSLLKVWRFPVLRRNTAILFMIWLFNGVAYYGLSWNSGMLGGDDYVNFTVSGAVEIPAYILVTLLVSRLGRRPVLSAALLSSAVMLVATVCVPERLSWLLVTLAMLGKFCVTASCAATYIISAEIFPTSVRNACMGAGSTMAGVGAMLASLILLLSTFWHPLPMLLIGCLTLTSGLLCLRLPETLHRDLPETLQDANK